jgi:hypothetical protein
MTGQTQPGDPNITAAVLRLADLASQIERTDNTLTRRTGELARELAETQEQLRRLASTPATLTSQADDINQRLADMADQLSHLADRITATPAPPDETSDDDGYLVNPTPPWWKPSDQRCHDTASRLADWVHDVYRPVYGYLADLLPPCWRQHPLCLAYLDALHEAWCLLHLQNRDPAIAFAQLDWLTRPLPQAAEIMATDTKRCRDLNHHTDPTQDAPPFPIRLPAQRPR